MADLEEQKFKVGMLMIDIFTKYIVVVPIHSKSEGDVAAGLLEGFEKFGAKPKALYTDDEGSFSTQALQTYFKEQGIQHIITRTHAPVAERAIRTIKMMLYKRIKADTDQWIDYLYPVLITYNTKMVHSATGFTPTDAKKEPNKMMVQLHLELKRVSKRKYPDINVGDKVKIYKKKDMKTRKQQYSVWSENSYEVTAINESLGQMFYSVSGFKRPLMRHEILRLKEN